ncbi:MAG: N-glycosylase/DNA lyase [Candidatus Asgardarchaeia archaeon]
MILNKKIELYKKIENLMKDKEVNRIIQARKNSFERMKQKSSEEWFSELCFCILTANSTAEKGIKIQNTLGTDGFLNLTLDELKAELKRLGHRFYNRRAEFIVKARRYAPTLKEIINSFGSPFKAREWLAKNIEGIGYKEASHFLRNVGFFDLAIVDRHIIRILATYGFIEKIPKTLTRKKYLEIEKILKKLAEQFNVPIGIFDLYLWYLATNKILK